MITEVLIKRLICNMCGHIWYSSPNTPKPDKCPACFDKGYKGWSYSDHVLKKLNGEFSSYSEDQLEGMRKAEEAREKDKAEEEMWRLETGGDDAHG